MGQESLFVLNIPISREKKRMITGNNRISGMLGTQESGIDHSNNEEA